MTFNPGFRVSVFDVLVLIAGIIGSVVVGAQLWWAGMVIAFVVGHFFLFCNVFRIARKAELIWAALFVVLSVSTVLYDQPGWTVSFAGSLLVAGVLIAHEMKKPSYHGIFWQRINPELLEWWEANCGLSK
jgi:hypothetical protein